MTMTDPISDMLTRIRNANVAMHDEVSMPSSKQKVALAKVLKDEGYISSFAEADNDGKPGKTLTIEMKYSPERDRVISGLKRVSKPGLRVYRQRNEIPRVQGGLGVAVLSTNKGLMSDREHGRTAWAAKFCASCGEEVAMSRVGNAPITVPSGVEIAIDGSNITVKGSKGELSRELPGGVTANLDEETLTVVRPDDSKESRAFHGLCRSLIQNMVVGVSEGFTKELQIQGVGYRATAKGSNALELALGYSHPVSIEAPEGIEFEVPQQTQILVKGIDKQLVGQVAADIRKWRKPEPYKGKGIRYANERVIRKAGKAAK